MRELYARAVATNGASREDTIIWREDTIICGSNIVASLNQLERYDEAKTMVRDQLLPAAQKSLGPDNNMTLRLNQRLAYVLANDPKATRDNPRLNRALRATRDQSYLNKQATTCSKPRLSCRTCGPEATAGLRPRASGHAVRQRTVVRRAQTTCPPSNEPFRSFLSRRRAERWRYFSLGG